MALTIIPTPSLRETPPLDASGLPSEPNLITFSQLYASLTPEKKACLSKEFSTESLSALNNGDEAITNPELEILNKCVNALPPKK